MGLVYRIVHRRYANDLFASGLAGRWNKENKKVLYTAENISLAYLETMYYRKGLGFNRDFKVMVIEIPESATVLDIDSSSLPKNWRDFRNYDACQALGDEWLENNEHLCLRVPSAVVIQNYNLVLNTLHKDYSDVKLLATLDFEPDFRLEEIIKGYTNS